MKLCLSLTLFLALYPLCGCATKPDNPAEVRERAATATAEIKRDTKAVAQGIREGWTQDKTLDINSASKEQLQSLPGVTSKLADSIIVHRPYSKASDLTEKHIMSKAEYDKIANQVTAKN